MISIRPRLAARSRGNGSPFRFTEPLEINDDAVAVSFLSMALSSCSSGSSSFILCNKERLSVAIFDEMMKFQENFKWRVDIIVLE
jgi:hypothetical protein